MSHFSAWLFSLMVLFAPPEKLAPLRLYSGVPESAEEMRERYKTLAEDLEEVVSDPDERLFFGGKRKREHTAAFMLAVAWMESGLGKHVQLGIGKYARGEGLDAGLPQVRFGKGQKTSEGWTVEEFLADPKKQFRTQLHLMLRSFYACRSLGLEIRLSAYTSGACISERGQASAKARYDVYRRMVAKLPLPEPEEPKVSIVSGVAANPLPAVSWRPRPIVSLRERRSYSRPRPAR